MRRRCGDHQFGVTRGGRVMLRHAVNRPKGREKASLSHDVSGKFLGRVASLLTWALLVVSVVLQAGGPCRRDDEADKLEREKHSNRPPAVITSSVDDLTGSS